MRRLLLVIFIIVLCLGCSKGNSGLEEDKGLESNATCDTLLKGCEDFIYISGEDLLNLNSINKQVQISKNINVSIMLKRGNPNGLDAYVFEKQMSSYITNLIYDCDEKNVCITDEFGFPLERYYYQIAAYDLDNDDKKELIFLAGDKKESLVVCIFEVIKKNKKTVVKLRDTYSGGKYAYIDAQNNIKLLK